MITKKYRIKRFLLEEVRYELYKRKYLLKEVDDDEGEDINVDGIELPKKPEKQPEVPKALDPNAKEEPPKTNEPQQKKLVNKTLPVITRDEAARFIKQETKGKEFIVSFIKKDKTNRIMVARLGVTKYLKGGSLPYNPQDFNYLPVFDTQISEYRILNLNTITSLTFNEQTYLIQEAL